MSAEPTLGAALRPVVEALETLGVRYLVGGSVASSALGMPRSTLDVDLVTDLGAAQVAGLVAALEADYHIEEGSVRDAISRRASFNLIHLATMLKVDVFIAGATPFDKVSFSRSVTRTLTDEPGARQYRLRSPEDVILRKLERYRLGGEVSDRQWGDAVGVLQIQAGALDDAYLDLWAGQLGVADLLGRARQDAGDTG